MKNKSIKNSRVSNQPKGQKGREDKKIELPKHQYPHPTEKDAQLKDQPEFIESTGNKKGAR